MSKSRHIRSREVRAAYRLLGEIGELRHDPHAWLAHLMGALCGLVGADAVCVANLWLPGPFPNQPPYDLQAIHGIEGEHEAQCVRDLWNSGDVQRQPDLVRKMQNPEPVMVLRRHEVVSDRDWYASDVIQRYHRGARFDHYLLFNAMLPQQGRLLGIDARHAWGKKPFTARSQRLMRLVGNELLKLLDAPAPPGGASPLGLPPRQQQVLDALCQGQSERKIAARLGISHDTVHTHVRLLHRRFGVDSRAELLAQHMAAPWLAGADLTELSLPRRQQQVLQLICRGKSARQIAVRLQLSANTVQSHIKALHRRLQASSRAELLAKALDCRWRAAPRLLSLPDDAPPDAAWMVRTRPVLRSP